jgi:predicted aspartyl protease
MATSFLVESQRRIEGLNENTYCWRIRLGYERCGRGESITERRIGSYRQSQGRGRVPSRGAVELNYRYAASGLVGTQTKRFDLAIGAFTEIDDLGGIRFAIGYDGKVPWQQDLSGTYTPQEGGDRIPVAVSAAYRYANLWWRADYGGATISDAGRDIVNDSPQDHLVIVPKGGKRFDAWFDAGTHLLTKVAEDRQFLHVIESYADYRREDGLNLAHKIVMDPGVGQDGVETSTLTHVSVAGGESLAVYAYPTSAPTGAVIVDGTASTSVPFRLLNNHVYVQGRVNGKGPYTFIVDSGGHTLLSSRIVSEVGLKTVGQSVESGAGAGHSTTGFVHYDEIAIGSVRLRDQMAFAAEVYDKSIEGIPVDGMVGFELLDRMVTAIDYGRNIITFTDPTRFHPSKDLGIAVPFVFYDHLPNVTGSIGDLSATFNIDTGSRSEIDITSPFVAAYQLRAHFPTGTSAVTGWGVGGPTRDYMVRLPSLKLGEVEVDQIAAGLSEDKGGSISNPNYSGNIGGGLLKRFVVTFDYAHQVMYLKRIMPIPPDVGTFDRSGLWINAKDGGYVVTDVAKGSAGERVGIAVGDVITMIDGKAGRDEELGDVRRLLRDRQAGSQLQLLVRRGTASHPITLILKDQI